MKKIKLFFDSDYYHALESVLIGHPEDTIPFTVSDYIIKDGGRKTLKEINGNYQTINSSCQKR